MQWILVVMISMCWCAVDALDCNISNNCPDMKADWLDPKYIRYTLTAEETAFLLGTGVGPLPPGIRRECRTLSDEARNLLFDAFKWLFTTTIVPGGLTRYEIFVLIHRQQMAVNAHFGPCFPGWHREFLWSLERALKQFDNSVSLCYWDSSLDFPLPNASHSCLWTPEYFGNGDGYVTTGFAANLTAKLECALLYWQTLYRQVGGNNNLFNQEKINIIYSKAYSFTNLMRPYGNCDFENHHGGVHIFVGGHMMYISCSPTDPIFFFHHAFIDYLFEQCRNRQTTDKETDYPSDLLNIPEFHWSFSPMQPFLKNCLDGLSNSYIPAHFSYLPSPGACTTHDDCGGKALWCNTGKCTSCVGPNGRMGASWPDRACLCSGYTTARNVNQVCTCA